MTKQEADAYWARYFHDKAKRLEAENERLRSHLTQIEAMAARHEESAEWEASAAIPAILGRARRALRGEDV